MLVWVQGSLCHNTAGSHPIQEAWGSQDSLYRGQIQKFLQFKNHTNRFCLLQRTDIEERVRDQKFWLYRDQTKCPNFAGNGLKMLVW